MKNKIKTIVIVATIILAVTSIGCFIGYRKTNEKDFIKYRELNNLDYTVCFKQPNDFYSEECLSKTINNYVTTYINYINVNFSYKLKLNRNIDSNYKYRVDARLTIFDRNDRNSIMNEKTYNLVEEKEVANSNVNEIEIAELVKIDYDDYNNFVTDYKMNANVQASANLRVSLYVESSNQNEIVVDPVKTNQEIAIDIPLNEATIELKPNYDPDYESPDVLINNQSGINKIFLIIFGVSGLLSIGTFIGLILFEKSKNKDKEILIYDKFINKLKNDYDSDITNITSLIDAEDEVIYEYLDVQSFKELYEVIKTNIDKKIIWNERKYFDNNGNVENRVSWFFIFVSDKNVMRLIIDENKLTREYEEDSTVLNRYRG